MGKLLDAKKKLRTKALKRDGFVVEKLSDRSVKIVFEDLPEEIQESVKQEASKKLADELLNGNKSEVGDFTWRHPID